ncbi:MAG TPA: hypothetical protein VKY53_06460 [Marinobacter sp.]|nr:hypothetical protein [Marinobacter sp.]
MDAFVRYHLLGRLLVYLEACGITPDQDTYTTALRMLWELDQACQSPLGFEAVLMRLPEYFPVPNPAVPVMAPTLARASIGYYPNG